MKRRVFVISDLHLGGASLKASENGEVFSTGIFRAHRQLVAFIDWLRKLVNTSDEEIELVVNGDLVDFLIEEEIAGHVVESQPWTPDQREAARKLDRIAAGSTDDGGRNIFDELARFVRAGAWLTILLGNHDVELSLPMVRGRLIALLGGPSSRLHFLYDGEAYSVGRLLIEHGNRYDAWNRLDYDSLREERSLLSRGIVPQSEIGASLFVPPPGSFLVTSFINRIKRRYPFVNLLKPETSLVVPLLFTLEPDHRASLDDVIKLAAVSFKRGADYGMRTPAVPRRRGLLSTTDEPANPPDSLASLLHGQFGEKASEFDLPTRGRSGQLSADDTGTLLGRLASVKGALSSVGSSFSTIVQPEPCALLSLRVRARA